MTEEEILGNSVLFFIAGYETTASTLNFLSYLLATHQDAQDKLLQEVDSVVGKVRFFYLLIKKMLILSFHLLSFCPFKASLYQLGVQ